MSKLKAVEKAVNDNGKVEEVSGFTLRQLKQLNQWLGMAVGSGVLGMKAHYWATYCIGKLKPPLDAYYKSIQSHPDHAAYIKAVGEPNAVEEMIKRQFPDYLKNCDELLDEKSDFKIRKFKAEWCLGGGASGPLSAALIDFDLLDDPDKLLDLVYKEG
jgi:hypothetical protein